jgi:glycosyltransferase involved in cell wall biosynthesis
MVAGVRTQWENMAPHILARSDVRAYIVELHPYRPGGLLERGHWLPPKVRGNLRTMQSAAGLFGPRKLDAVWCHDLRASLPYVLTKARLLQTVLVSAFDSTSAQQAAFGAFYEKAARGVQAQVRDTLERFSYRRAHLLNPWSLWAARSLIGEYRVPEERVRVLPPGIDLARWPFVHQRDAGSGVLRVLFVGGDFARKGGRLLLDVYREQLQGIVELHLVTHETVSPMPGVHLYRDLQPNDPQLRALYAQADVFVLPTNADCFSLASLEAMATGRPVIATTVGGIPEIVAEGSSGFLIAPGDGHSLLERLLLLRRDAPRRTAMGAEGRRIVEARFDAARNTETVLSWIAQLVAQRRGFPDGRQGANGSNAQCISSR